MKIGHTCPSFLDPFPGLTVFPLVKFLFEEGKQSPLIRLFLSIPFLNFFSPIFAVH